VIDGLDIGFLRFEQHALSCTACQPIYHRQLAWNGRGEKPGPLCTEGEWLWAHYLFPGSVPQQTPAEMADDPGTAATAPESTSAGDAALATMPEEASDVLARCARCPRLPDEGYRTCGGCRSAYAQRQRELKARRRREKTCVRCGGEPEGDGWCAACRAWATAHYRKIKEKGVCAKCWKTNPEPHRTYCAGCRAQDAEKKRLHRAAAKVGGLCYGCRKTPPEDGSARCRACIDKGNAQKRAHWKASRADRLAAT